MVTMPKLRMKIGISGTVAVGDGKTYDSLKRGMVIETDERTAAQFLEAGYAETRLEGDIGEARKPEAVPHW
jgi:hypothetical protein